jgi:hypothetical protein
MKVIRAILRVISGLVSIIGLVVLFVLSMKTLMFDYYDPRGEVVTFIHIEAIAGAILAIRWFLKPEYKWEPSRHTDFGTRCSMCYQDMNDCSCHEDEESDKNTLKYSSPCSNNSCDKIHTVGSQVRYDKNYNIYCDNNECSENINTIGSTILEECWWNSDADDDIPHDDRNDAM